MRDWRLVVGLVVSVLLGTAAGLVPALRAETDPIAAVEPPGDRVKAAIEELRVDRVHVPEDGRGMLDEAGERRLEALLADADPAVYVVVWAETNQAGYGSPYDVVDQLGAAIDPRAVMVVWEGPGRGDVGTLDGYVPAIMAFEGEPEARITELVEQLRGQTVEPRDEEPTGEVIAGGLAGSMGGAAAYGLLMLVVGLVRLARRRPFLVPGPWQKDPS
ncbi:hypothetical protein [Nocardioides lijunqiniae]|uniref:hypothetical protein n=1 Tax=Nocardioides lijunqiniae TaxID=2760832 RepID=UPI00187772C5|nr:hypothetical protein [Nocardioides lijunqiniae]